MRYRLDELGWLQFENLCQSLLKTKYGNAIESWGGTRDIGRDAFCKRPIELVKGTWSKAPLVFQVKFIAGANAPGADWKNPLLSAVRKEASILSDRREKRKVQDVKEYILITNSTFTLAVRDEITDILGTSLPDANPTLLGGNDVCDWLDEQPNIRWSFPQLVSLRDLQLLMDDRLKLFAGKAVKERSTLQLELAKKEARTFVPTKTYSSALEKLGTYNFLVLSGAPEVGKTTIARMIGLNAFYLGWECYEVRSPEEMLTIIERNSQLEDGLDSKTPSQLFIADDAFGTTEYEADFARAWSRDLDKVMAALDSNHFMIWTSRSAPLTLALEHLRLQGPAEDFPHPSKIIVDAAELTIEEKALILYRHAKQAGLADIARTFLQKHAYRIVNDRHFTPERIRRLVRNDLAGLAESFGLTSNKKGVSAAIARQLRDPTISMRQSFSALSEPRQHFLISLLDCSAYSIPKQEVYDKFLRLFGDIADKQPPTIAEDLEEQFIRLVRPNRQEFRNEDVYEWVHPSWRDLVIDCLIEHRITRRRFLGRCSIAGIALSLSSAGGASGERSLPLLLEATDWDYLRSNLEASIPNMCQQDNERLLHLIGESLKSCPKAKKKQLIELASCSVQWSAEAWSQERTYAGIEALKSFYAICKELQIVIDPGLKVIWNAAIASLADLVLDVTDFEYLADELSYVSGLMLIIENENLNYYKQIQSGSIDQSLALENALNIFLKAAEIEYDGAGHEREYMESCIDRFNSCKRSLEIIAGFAPEYNENAKAAAKCCTKYARNIEELQQEPDYEEDNNRSSFRSLNDATESVTIFSEQSVFELFLDL